MTKTRIAVCLLLTMVLILPLAWVGLPAVQADSEKEEMGKKLGGVGGSQKVTNGILKLEVDPDGAYTVGTGANHPVPNANVLYGGGNDDAWSSFNTIRVYDTLKEYAPGNRAPSPGFTFVSLNTCGPVVSASDNVVTTTWTTPENLLIEQVTAVEGTTLADSRVRVTTKVTNNNAPPSRAPGGATLSIGIRYLWDLMVARNDAALYAERLPDTAWMNTEKAYAPPGFRHYAYTNSPTSPAFIIFGTAKAPTTLTPPATPPHRLVYASWYASFYGSYAFDYNPNAESGMDSAMLYYWGHNTQKKLPVPAGGTQAVTAYLCAVQQGGDNPIEPPSIPDVVGCYDVTGRFQIFDWMCNRGPMCNTGMLCITAQDKHKVMGFIHWDCDSESPLPVKGYVGNFVRGRSGITNTPRLSLISERGTYCAYPSPTYDCYVINAKVRVDRNTGAVKQIDGTGMGWEELGPPLPDGSPKFGQHEATWRARPHL